MRGSPSRVFAVYSPPMLVALLVAALDIADPWDPRADVLPRVDATDPWVAPEPLDRADPWEPGAEIPIGPAALPLDAADPWEG
jgi:hypothetical protein